MEERLEFKKLMFQSSKTATGKFIGKVKTYEDKDGKKDYKGDLIVIANPDSGVKSEGKYDVKVRKMTTGKGYVVLSAVKVYDELTISRKDFDVLVLVNGREEKLKTEDNKYIPISFYANRPYPALRIAKAIQRKAAYLFINPDFDVAKFCASFVEEVAKAEREFSAHQFKLRQEEKQREQEAERKRLEEQKEAMRIAKQSKEFKQAKKAAAKGVKLNSFEALKDLQ